MNKLKVSTRLIALIGVLSTLLVAIGILGIFAVGRSNDALRSVYETRLVGMRDLGTIESLLRHRLALSLALVTPTPEVVTERTAQIDTNIALITKTWADYMSTTMSPEESALAAQWAHDRKKFLDDGLLPAVAALRANQLEDARHIILETVRQLYTPVETGAATLKQHHIEAAQREYADASTRYARMRLVFICAIGLGLSFAALFGYAMVRSISRQLGAEPGEAAALAQSVASGNLSAEINLAPGDETSLMAQLDTMQQSLATVVRNVRRNAETVAVASGQIANGNQDLSQRTEEQAAALQQTAASMEQLSSTVSQNALNAERANQLAHDACTLAEAGGDVVGKVVNTMKSINQSSTRISDIIAVIEGIAFQTNILALNAAVEAARAGEQGRGFAVVAGEVRNLAKRSTEAAKEIKSLINASVSEVERGSVLVDSAGTTMDQVVASVRRVTVIMDEISVASAEQSAGVCQVGKAVSQMDQVTQQNAALVEEGAAAAESLQQQAAQLVDAMSVFRVEQHAEAFA